MTEEELAAELMRIDIDTAIEMANIEMAVGTGELLTDEELVRKADQFGRLLQWLASDGAHE